MDGLGRCGGEGGIEMVRRAAEAKTAARWRRVVRVIRRIASSLSDVL